MMAVLLGATNLYGVSRLMANLRRGGGFIGVIWSFMGGLALNGQHRESVKRVGFAKQMKDINEYRAMKYNRNRYETFIQK